VLLEAYLSEFTADDPVELHILTKPYDKADGGVSGAGRGPGWGRQSGRWRADNGGNASDVGWAVRGSVLQQPGGLSQPGFQPLPFTPASPNFTPPAPQYVGDITRWAEGKKLLPKGTAAPNGGKDGDYKEQEERESKEEKEVEEKDAREAEEAERKRREQPPVIAPASGRWLRDGPPPSVSPALGPAALKLPTLYIINNHLVGAEVTNKSGPRLSWPDGLLAPAAASPRLPERRWQSQAAQPQALRANC
jgi:hypothetical protein